MSDQQPRPTVFFLFCAARRQEEVDDVQVEIQSCEDIIIHWKLQLVATPFSQNQLCILPAVENAWKKRTPGRRLGLLATVWCYERCSQHLTTTLSKVTGLLHQAEFHFSKGFQKVAVEGLVESILPSYKEEFPILTDSLLWNLEELKPGLKDDVTREDQGTTNRYDLLCKRQVEAEPQHEPNGDLQKTMENDRKNPLEAANKHGLSGSTQLHPTSPWKLHETPRTHHKWPVKTPRCYPSEHPAWAPQSPLP